MTHVLDPGTLAAGTRPGPGPGTAFDDVTRSDAALRAFLHGLPGVDQVGAEQRAATLGTRSIKTTAKAWAIDAAISMVDLTTLEGADTPGKVRSLAADRKSTRLNSSHANISYAVFCLKKKRKTISWSYFRHMLAVI